METKTEITEQDIQRYASKRGPQNASKLLSVLGKNKQFLNAWESPVGQELMNQLLVDAEGFLEKIIEDKATPEEKAEFRAIRRWLSKVASKIGAYYKDLETLKRGK